MDKKKKGKTPPVAQVGLYEMLTLDEVNAMEQKYNNRINEIRGNSLNFYSDALRQTNKIDDEQRELDKWDAYVNCDQIPKPYIPADIRTFMTKKQYFEDITVDRNIDWLLSVDERSILSQNLFRKDCTRAALSKSLKPEYGKEYDEFVDNALNLLKRIEYFLDNRRETAKASQRLLEDIKIIKPLVQEEIKSAFDRYTYRILCNEDAFMNSVNAITGEYCFSCKNFDIHIWSLKSVPIRFTHLLEPRMIANLHNMNMVLHIPYSMLRPELTIQAIHMHFDLFSEYAISFKHNVEASDRNLNSDTQDLSQSLLNEWIMLREIQERVREKMIEARLNYEEKLQLIEEEEKKAAKELQKEGDKNKTPQFKRPKLFEPPTVGANEYPNVHDDFLIEENEQYVNFLNNAYNPNNFKLESDEINLKKYFILGGVYQLYYVQKPKHYNFNFNRFNMTTHCQERKLIVEKNLLIPEPSSNLQQSSISDTIMSTIEIEPTPKEPLKDEVEAENPWFVVTFYLPEHLCLWGEPIACHYETVEKEVIDEPSKLDLYSVIKPKDLISAKHITPKVIMLNPDSDEDKTQELAVDVLNKATTRSLTSRITYRSIDKSLGVNSEICHLDDFPLDRTYDKLQVRQMQRHCIPHIISSYKFPREINEESLATENARPKGKTGTLFTKAHDDYDFSTSNALFSYDSNQNNPERMFAAYPVTQSIYIHNRIMPFKKELPHEPQTFYQLIKTLILIKRYFQSRLQNIIDLPSFKSTIDIEALRRKIKDKSKKKQPIILPSRESLQIIPKYPRKSSRLRMVSRKSARSLDSRLSSKAKLGSMTTLEAVELDSLEEEEGPPKKTIMHTRWTTQHIKRFSFNRAERKYMLETDRLGCIGFAFKRYEHFPFKYWELHPSETDPEHEVIFTLETQYVKCVLKVTGKGINGYVTEPTKKYVRNPKMYLVIDKPMRDYTEFKKRFKENNINIFADRDASFYIEKGYFSQKHFAAEMHTYNCMALHCNQIKFNQSIWNRLAQRRDIVLEFMGSTDNIDNKVLAHITPEQASFVEITELCSPDIDTIKLDYKHTWRNIASYCDLHQMIVSMYTEATDYRCKDAKLICCLRDLLAEVRPFSFS